MMFELHPDLKKDCFLIGKFPLSYLLLMNDKNYPWFILVPGRVNIKEIYELSEEDQIELMKESSYLTKKLNEYYKADKMNIAALGNVTPQLHIHHIVRFKNDPSFPSPVWGKVEKIPYSPEERKNINSELKKILTENFAFRD